MIQERYSRRTPLLCCIFYLTGIYFCFSQNKNNIDSLETALKVAVADTQKIKCLRELGFLYQDSEPSKGLEYASQGVTLAEEAGHIHWEARCLNIMGVNYERLGNYTKAIQAHFKALDIYLRLKDEKGKSVSYNNLGQVYSYQGEYAKAINSHIKALEIRDKIGEKDLISVSLTNIGVTYYLMQDFTKALQSFQKALLIDEEREDKAGISKMLNNIGLVYEQQEKYDEALFNYKRSLFIKQEIGDKLGVANSLGNVGNTYYHKRDYGNTLYYWQLSIQMFKELNNTTGIISMLSNIGRLYADQKKYEKATAYTDSSLSLAYEIGSKQHISNTCSQLADIYFSTKNFEKAYRYQKEFTAMKDSLLNEEKTKHINELSTIYETEKKEKDNQLLRSEIQVKEMESNRKNLFLSLAGVVAMFFLALAFFIYKWFRQKKRANILLEIKNSEIERQNAVIEEKNKNITDSIRYAERIQRAILPPVIALGKALPDSFVYYVPRDIVSGDFYWLHQYENDVFIAACDCTGHGVPGAFMSMIGKDQLNHIVVEKNVLSTADILSQLNKGIKYALHQDAHDELLVQDGMEIALLKIDTRKNELSFSGANRPLYVIRQSKLLEFTSDKFPIGGHTENNYQFTSKNIPLYKGDMIYICSDGYADQFGGVKGKKITTRGLKSLLTSISHLSVKAQNLEVSRIFQDWKGGEEQVDDILLIGIRI